MAGVTSMQAAILGSPVMGVSSRSTRGSQFLSAPFMSRVRRTGSVSVRCMSEGEGKGPENEKKQPVEPVTTTTTPPKPKATPPPKVSPKWSDILAFSGPAPERINGRLAMIGFVTAMAVELSNGQDLFSQISNGGIPWFVGTSVVLSLASLIPLFKGVSAESESDGFMTSDAELWNGRFAMLGLVALAFTEYVKGGTLV